MFFVWYAAGRGVARGVAIPVPHGTCLLHGISKFIYAERCPCGSSEYFMCVCLCVAAFFRVCEMVAVRQCVCFDVFLSVCSTMVLRTWWRASPVGAPVRGIRRPLIVG